MSINEVFEMANATSKFLHWENGTFAVYDTYEYEHYDDAKPEFVGKYGEALDYVKRCDREICEDMLF